MRKIGLVGGMSWYSTALYYKYINEQIARRDGGMASAPIVLESFNFADIGRAESEQDWQRATRQLKESAMRLVDAGATAIFICANSMHRLYDEISDAVHAPVIHIADCVGEKMASDGVKSATLIGTKNVMTENWYRQRLVKHGITLSPPNMDRVHEIDRIIYAELMQGRATRNAERTMKTFITNIDKQGVKAIVLGCTELGMVVDTRANILPIYDSAMIHAAAAVDWIMEPVDQPALALG